MTIPLSGNESLPARLGKIGVAYLSALGEIRDTAANITCSWGANGPPIKDLHTAINAIAGQYTATGQNITDGLYPVRDTYRSAKESYLTSLAKAAQVTVINMANDDVKLPDRTLKTALTEIIRQMGSSGDSVKKNTASVSVSAVSTNTGNTTVMASVVGPDGLTREYVYPETITIKATTDGQRGGTAGSETMSSLGEPKAAGMNSWDYPKGSASSKTLTIVNPALDATGGNLLTNSDFGSFNGSTPQNWTIITGTAGTSIGIGANSYLANGTSSLKITGDASELTTISQNVSLSPNTVYSLWAAVKMSAAPSNGTLAFSLANATSHTVIANDQSSNQTISQNLTSLTTAWAVVSGFFQTPKVLPSSTELKVHLTTALDASKTAQVQIGLAAATEQYVGGPYLSAFRGSVDVALDDTWKAVVSNNGNGGFGSGGKLQSLADRWFDMRTLGLQLPSSTNGTISDSTYVS